jgi:hypothetical protein
MLIWPKVGRFYLSMIDLQVFGVQPFLSQEGAFSQNGYWEICVGVA